MRVPLDWLADFVDPQLPVRELAERLALTGTEVDRILHHGVGGLEHFVVGRVLTAEQHPDADRLRVCTVDVGEAEPSTIVCGAPNVAAGQAVAVARPGSIMPDGTKLKKAKLRGLPSEGMICAVDELGIGTDHDGILVLDEPAPEPGTALASVLPIATDVLELELTPNRPDCLGIYGVAREVHAATGAPLGPPPWADDDAGAAGPLSEDVVRIDVRTDRCERFTARALEGIEIGTSPPWLTQRLLAAGMRPINNVVDVTNYVMHLTGQPLHAFDLDRIAGGTLTIRQATDGEQITTLDDVARTLTADDVVIEDADGPTSIAGIMGGQRSEVQPDTTRVLLEVATWDGPTINATMARLALRSEAGARNEKGLAPEQALEAQAVATRLLVEVCGATLVPGTSDHGGAGGAGPARRSQVIRLRDARVEGLLGAPVARADSARVLEALGFGVAEAGDGLDVSVPPFRRLDVTREADVIEEVARLVALEALPSTLPRVRTGRAATLTPAQRGRRRAEDVLTGLGLHEVAGWSFTSSDVLDRLRLPDDSPLRRTVALENPMSAEQAILRPSILPSLLDIAARNVARGHGDLAIFESAAVYRAWEDPAERDRPADEHHALAVLLRGAGTPASWLEDGAARPADVVTAKGVLEAVLRALRVPFTVDQSAVWPFLHPARSAAVVAEDGERLGFLGEVHPLVAQAWELDGIVATFALDLGKVLDRAPEVVTYRDLTSFPALRQDLAVVVADDVPAARVLEVVRAAGGARLASAEVFDVYRGAQLGEGRTSLALHLEFRASDRTLTDEDVAPIREKLVARLAAEVGGELRG